MVDFNKIKEQCIAHNVFVSEFYDKYIIDFFVQSVKSKILPDFMNYVVSNPFEMEGKDHVKLIKNFEFPYHVCAQYGGYDTTANIKIYKKYNNEQCTYYIKYRIIAGGEFCGEGFVTAGDHLYFNIELEFVKHTCIIKMRKDSIQLNDFSLASAIADHVIKNKLAKNIKFRTFNGYEENKVSTFCLYEKNMDVAQNIKYLDNITEIYIVSLRSSGLVPKKLLDKLKAKNVNYYYR